MLETMGRAVPERRSLSVQDALPQLCGHLGTAAIVRRLEHCRNGAASKLRERTASQRLRTSTRSECSGRVETHGGLTPTANPCHNQRTNVPIAQLDRVSASEAEGWRFESSWGYLSGRTATDESTEFLVSAQGQRFMTGCKEQRHGSRVSL